MMKRMMPKIATRAYDMNRPSKSTSCAVFRMLLTQGCPTEGFIQPYPKSTETLGFQRMLKYKNNLKFDWNLDITPKVNLNLQ